MGGSRKQFRTLGGKTLLVQTLAAFQRHPGVHHLVVAVPREETEPVSELLNAEGLSKVFRVVAGGATRQASVYEALKALPDTVDAVLVHDAVRPFVSESMISSIIEALFEHGSAAVAAAVADTLRVGDGRSFEHTIPREHIYRMQTPQAARRSWFEKAFLRAEQEGWQATDDVDLLQRAGFNVAIVEGSSLNFKITTPADWEMARILWPHWEANLS